jgi:hypothetical protein
LQGLQEALLAQAEVKEAAVVVVVTVLPLLPMHLEVSEVVVEEEAAVVGLVVSILLLSPAALEVLEAVLVDLVVVSAACSVDSGLAEAAAAADLAMMMTQQVQHRRLEDSGYSPQKREINSEESAQLLDNLLDDSSKLHSPLLPDLPQGPGRQRNHRHRHCLQILRLTTRFWTNK